MNAELIHRPGENLSIGDFGWLVKIAHAKVMTPTNIISGFGRRGIFPFDENFFKEHEFFWKCCNKLA